MRTISYAECNSFEEVRKLLERVFGEIDDINQVIAPEKAKRLLQIAKDKALIEKKAKAEAEASAKAEAKAKTLAAAQSVIDRAKAAEENKAKREAEAADVLKEARRVISASKKGGR